MLTSPRLPQLPGAQDRSQTGFYAETMAAGYGISTHVSCQHGGLVPPDQKKSSSSISRSGSARATGILDGWGPHEEASLLTMCPV
jgi:hypothetical protein